MGKGSKVKTNSLKHIPNLLSIIRIFLSLYIIVIWKDHMLFLIVYTICGFTDMLDGYIARKFNAVSKIGAVLDSLGDLSFFIVITYWIVFRSSIVITKVSASVLVVVILIRVVNIIITKMKFKQFAIMHTVLNKITGALYFLMVPILLFDSDSADGIVRYILITAVVSAIEEFMILLLKKDYHVNHKSIVSTMIF